MTIKKAEAAANQASAFAGAKINLTLRVTGQREDGFHLLESMVVHALDVGDTVAAQQASENSLTLSGSYGAELSAGADNLVLKAARALSTKHFAHLSLQKELPVASGIGGGSADAAATLHILNELWDLGHSEAELAAIGEGLGADVSMCLNPEPSFVTGIGDVVSPIALPELHCVLANPGIALSTPEVFSRRTEPFRQASRFETGFTSPQALATYLRSMGNDLLQPAASLVPEICAVQSALNEVDGCLYASMSGSGATCFGLFETRAEAHPAAQKLKEQHPSWWVAATTTKGNCQWSA